MDSNFESLNGLLVNQLESRWNSRVYRLILLLKRLPGLFNIVMPPYSVPRSSSNYMHGRNDRYYDK